MEFEKTSEREEAVATEIVDAAYAVHKASRSVKCLKFGVPKVTDYFSTLAHFRHFSSL